MSIEEPDGSSRFTADEITGMFISMMFAGHHTTSGTAAWTLIELLRHPDEMAAVVARGRRAHGRRREMSYQALREIPRLESAIKEALRLHPPLIMLLRVAKDRFEVGGLGSSRVRWSVRRSPCRTAWPRPSRIVTSSIRAVTSTPATKTRRTRGAGSPSAPVATGASALRSLSCSSRPSSSPFFTVGSSRRGQPLDSYRNDHSKMVVQLAQPCIARYRRRSSSCHWCCFRCRDDRRGWGRWYGDVMVRRCRRRPVPGAACVVGGSGRLQGREGPARDGSGG